MRTLDQTIDFAEIILLEMQEFGGNLYSEAELTVYSTRKHRHLYKVFNLK